MGVDKYKMEMEAGPTFTSSWWSRRTFMERGLMVLFVVSIIAAGVLVAVLSVFISSQVTTSEEVTPMPKAVSDAQWQETCMTTECVQTAARIINGMDTKVDPCDDFFEYACGNWIKKNVIPDDMSRFGIFDQLHVELQTTLKGLIEEPVSDNEPTASTKSKHMYQSCLNMDLINEIGDQPLVDFIEHLGGWPVLDSDWDEQNFDWVELVVKSFLHSNDVLISMWVGTDDKNSSINTIQLDQTTLGLSSRDYFLDERENNTVQAYLQFATDVAVLLGAPKERAMQEMTEAVQFEKELANITIPKDQRRDLMAMYQKFYIHELYTNITEYINWLRYFNLIFQNINYNITMDHEVVVYAPEYMTDLAKLLKVTPNKTIANYVVWRITKNRVGSLDSRYLDVLAKYKKARYGIDSEPARWRSCISNTNSWFGIAVGRLYVMEKFPESAKSNALEMIGNIRRAFKDLLKEAEWMDDETRQAARGKADAIQELIGYPEYITNTTILNAMYNEYVIHPDKYFENTLKNLQTWALSNIKKILKQVNKNEWVSIPAVVNAFYQPSTNRIVFPAGILQPPFYHENYPKSFNYGGIGMVIGHEITHGFDDRGRQLDKDGNLVQWWSDNVVEKFKTQVQCIIDQYSNFSIPEIDMNLNGKQTQGENIADNGGLKQAFRAYREWIESQGREEDLLPGLSMNHNQLFFLNFAQTWCSAARPKTYIRYIRSGVHPYKQKHVEST